MILCPTDCCSNLILPPSRPLPQKVPCIRTSKHCNSRRAAASGMNHTHPLEIARPEVDYSYYERAVALRQEVIRLGMSATTGKGDGEPQSVNERCEILAVRIAEFHKRQATIMEVRLNWGVLFRMPEVVTGKTTASSS